MFGKLIFVFGIDVVGVVDFIGLGFVKVCFVVCFKFCFGVMWCCGLFLCIV